MENNIFYLGREKTLKGRVNLKGISPLISSVLLIAFVITVGMLVMGWMTTLTRSTTAAVTNKTTEGVGCSSASINIETVYLTTGASGSSRAVVKNTGFRDLQIISAQMFSNIGANFSATNVPVAGFAKGDIETLIFGNINMPLCSNFSRLIVTTECGGIADTFIGTPKC